MAKKQQRKIHDNIQLTPDQEAALDRAWNTITDAEIEESVRWLDDHPISQPPKEQPNGRQQQPQ